MKNLYFFTKLIVVTGISISSAFGQWQGVANYPMATDGAFGFSIGNIAYIGGGLSGNNIYAYDTTINMWTQKTSVPSPGTHLGWASAFSIGGKAYVVGGSYASASDLTDDLWEYDPATDMWSQKADFPGGARDGMFCFVANGKAYLGGGFDGTYLAADFYQYDPATDTWKSLDPYPGGPVIFAAAFTLNDKGYVGTGGQGSIEISDIWQFDPLTEQWSQKASFPGSLRQATVSFVVNGKGYIGGGMSGYNTIYKDFWSYDAQLDAWAQLSGGTFPTDQIAWSTAFVIGQTAYVGLGTSLPNFNFSNAVYKFNFETVMSIERHEWRDANLNYYPNPAQDVVYIEFTTAANSRLSYDVNIYNNLGQLVKRVRSSGPKMAINTGHIPKGIYTIVVGTGKNSVKKLIEIQ